MNELMLLSMLICLLGPGREISNYSTGEALDALEALALIEDGSDGRPALTRNGRRILSIVTDAFGQVMVEVQGRLNKLKKGGG